VRELDLDGLMCVWDGFRRDETGVLGRFGLLCLI